MIVMTKKVSILVPDSLLATLTGFLESASDMRDAMEGGAIFLSTDSDTQADLLLAPSLESALQWGYNRNIHWPTAVTLASGLLAQFSGIAARGGVVIIREQDLRRRPNLVLEAIAQKIGFSRGLKIERPHIPKVQEIANDGMSSRIAPLRMYSEMPVPEGMWALWSSYLFCNDDGPADRPIDVTGRARLLFSGPKISLSPGAWRADVLFELTGDATPYDYFLDIGSGEELERVVFRPQKAGEQRVSVLHIAHDSTPVEIRVGLLRAAFHGELKLRCVWVIKTAEAMRAAR